VLNHSPVKRGTLIKLKLREDMETYSSEKKVSDNVKKFSEFVS